MSKVKATDYFAMIPEWVLYGEISPSAVRVFGCLNRFANGQTGKCHPSRQTIARLCHISIKTVDRAIDELVKLGALTVVNRGWAEDGEITTKTGEMVNYTSNEYTLIMSLGRVNLTPPLGKSDARGSVKNDSLIRASLNESQEPDTSTEVEVATKPLDEQLSASWWESRPKKPLGKNAWWTLRSVVKAALDRGYSPEEITAALNRYGTIPSLAAFDRELQQMRPKTKWAAQMTELGDYLNQRTHNPFDLPDEPPTGELNP